MLAMGGTAASAVDQSGKGEGRMHDSPNAAGFDKETTATTDPGASSRAPGQEMKENGRMQGSPNASGFKGDGAGSSAGSGGGR